MKQHEVVQLAMARNGGYATLGHLYHVVTKLPEWQSDSLTPFASIRRIVQTAPGFYRIRPGLWGLEEKRDAIGKQLALPEYAAPEKVEEFNHSYYQGLLLEIGNLKQFQTFVPHQDKNKPFLQKKLAEVATLPQFYEFTYSEIMGRAKTVDVSWFNGRKFPDSFFEVEHSTDIYNSLLKFVEFQDFRIQFWIVANEARHNEFKNKVSYTAFDDIRSDVRFLSYKALSDWHSKIAESIALENLIHR